MVKIFACKISSRLSAPRKKKISAVLSEKEINKAGRFRREKDGEVSLASSFLTRKIISSFVGAKPAEIVFSTTRYGRPQLVSPKSKNLDFNLSHSGSWIVLAVGEGQVGIDVEQMRPIDMDIAEAFFTAKEVAYIQSIPKKEKERFFEIWTLKESFIKAIGKGLSYPLKNVEFEIAESGKIKACFKNHQGAREWYFKMYDLDADYKLAVCLNHNRFPAKVSLVKI